MDIVDFTVKFHALETKYNLFHEQDSNDVLYWDIVRHDVFYAIYYELSGIQTITTSRNPSILSKIISIFKYGYHALRLSIALKAKSYKYFCFTCSRYKNENKENIDYAVNDLLLVIKAETLILESNIKFNDEYYHDCFFNVGPVINTYKFKVKRLGRERKHYSSFTVSQILKKEFGVNTDIDLVITNLINRYNIEYSYYLKLFKKSIPEKIFLVQNGIQKALFHAANNLEIPVYEMQHGLVSFIHPAYDYPKHVDLSHLKTLPTYFLSFSEFWSNNIHYPVKKIRTIGNTFFAQKPALKDKVFDLTFISADIYALDLIALLDDLLVAGFEKKIAVKLHPNQFHDLEYIKRHFSSFPNVTIVFNELSVKELLLVSQAILAVQSTCVYEALYYQVKVLIYKIKDYRTHEDIFDNPNVYQIVNHTEIKSCLNNSYISGNNIPFFENFKTNQFLELLY